MKASTVDDFLGTRPAASSRQRLLWLLLGLALIVLIGLVGRFVNGGAPTPYATVDLIREDLRAEIAGSGRLQPSGLEAVPAQEPGVIAAVLVRQGEPVRKGQLLAQLDPAPVEREIASATTLLEERRSATAAAQKQVDELRGRMETFRRVRAESGGLAPSDREMALAADDLRGALAALRAAAVEAEAAEAIVAEREARLSRREIRAPHDGVILTRPQPGREARADPADRLFELAAPYSRLKLEIMLRRAEAYGLHVGDPAQVDAAQGQGRSFPATVTALRPARSADASRVILVLDVANPGRVLRPGLAVNARIDAGVRQQALVVPEAALQFARGSDASKGLGGGDAIYILDHEGKPRRVAVQVAGRSGDRIAVASDELSPGTPIITGLR